MRNAVKNLVALVVTLSLAVFIDLPMAMGQLVWFGFVWLIKANPTESDTEIASLLGVEPWWEEEDIW